MSTPAAIAREDPQRLEEPAKRGFAAGQNRPDVLPYISCERALRHTARVRFYRRAPVRKRGFLVPFAPALVAA